MLFELRGKSWSHSAAWMALVACMIVIGRLTVCGETPRESAAISTGTLSAPRILRVAVPPDGLLAPPVFRMIKTQPLAASGITIESVSWRNQEQLRAIIVSGKADLVGLHLPTAALFAKKGLSVRFLGASLGNVLYIITNDPQAHALKDLRGKKLAAPMRGEFPDVLLRSTIEQSGLTDQIQLKYVATSMDAANLVGSGEVPAALVAEPHASILLERLRNPFAKPKQLLYASVNMQLAWNAARRKVSPMPTAGLAAFGDLAKNEKLLGLFWRAYVDAADWCIQNPQGAVELLGDAMRDKPARDGAARAFTACARRPVASALDRQQIEDYLEALGKTAPEPFGGLRPGDAFYWNPSQSK